MGFPSIRMRRLRGSGGMRRLVSTVRVSVDDLIYPLFVCPGEGVKTPIGSMEGCYHFSADRVGEEARAVYDLGIPAVLLFGLPKHKDAQGSEAWAADSAVCRSIAAIKQAAPELLVITDVCLCAYTDHGHCGVIREEKVDNDLSLQNLAKMSLAHAQAGADMIAPSDMMDGRVGMIRQTLDEAGFTDRAIMSYAAKYASAFYGPFRDAAHSAPGFGDRRSYQMDPAAGVGQAMREMALDLEEGADILMVKPVTAYLDVLAEARRRFDAPLAAYHVSGEYMMICRAAEAGLLNRREAMLETLTAIQRAGANMIITYFAKEAAGVLR